MTALYESGAPGSDDDFNLLDADIVSEAEKLIGAPRTTVPPTRRPGDAPAGGDGKRTYDSFGILTTCSPSKPYRVAMDVRDKYFLHDGHPTLRRWQETWMRWDGTCWRIINREEMHAWLYKAMDLARYTKTNDDGTKEIVEWTPIAGKIVNLDKALAALVNLPDATDKQTWASTGEREKNVVSTMTGLLRLSDRALLPHNPDFFTTYSLPYDYDPAAQCPEWLKFLNVIMEHDPQAILTLQEIFGYIVSGRTDLQKMFLIVGPPRGGKGTIGRTLSALIGDENVCGCDLAQLEENFGMWDLAEATLGLFGDVTFDNNTKIPKEKLLRISGEDPIRIDRKNRQPVSRKIPARLVMLSNHIPNFGDSSGALPSRFVDIRLVKGFLGAEDLTLGDRILRELPGILNWALDGLDRLNEQGKFTESLGGEEMKELQKAISAPEQVFIEEFCELGDQKTHWVLKEEFRHAYVCWRASTGVGGQDGPVETERSISRKLFAAAPTVRGTGPGTRKLINGEQKQVYVGIRLKKNEPGVPRGIFDPKV